MPRSFETGNLAREIEEETGTEVKFSPEYLRLVKEQPRNEVDEIFRHIPDEFPEQGDLTDSENLGNKEVQVTNVIDLDEERIKRRKPEEGSEKRRFREKMKKSLTMFLIGLSAYTATSLVVVGKAEGRDYGPGMRETIKRDIGESLGRALGNFIERKIGGGMNERERNYRNINRINTETTNDNKFLFQKEQIMNDFREALRNAKNADEIALAEQKRNAALKALMEAEGGPDIQR